MKHHGQGAVVMASAGIGTMQRTWGMKQERRTPRYMTRLEEVLVVGGG